MPRSYFLLFAMQTIGAAILFWYAVPLFRQVLLDPGSHVPRTGKFGLVVVGDHVDAGGLLDTPSTSSAASRRFVTHSLATLFYLLLACRSYLLLLFLASSSFCEGLNSRYPPPAT